MSNLAQRNSTRNQSTADIEFKRLFIFDNRFKEGVFRNTTAAVLNLLPYSLVARSTTVANGLIPVTPANLADAIGITANDQSIDAIPVNGNVNINIGTKGTIEGNFINLPATVTLNTVVGNKTLKDVLEAIGFHIEENATENTKYDN